MAALCNTLHGETLRLSALIVSVLFILNGPECSFSCVNSEKERNFLHTVTDKRRVAYKLLHTLSNIIIMYRQLSKI